jgi:hypothetical protein
MSTSFSELIAQDGRVEIPMIQRDYAQGREDQSIVRDEFLNALHGALTRPGNRLDLDFVYGAVVNNAFQPLDGQQRLTTLYLLHWYLAWVDDRSKEFRDRFVAEQRSCFRYEVRPSSGDFIDRLAQYEPRVAVAESPKLSQLITDEPWFFRSWRFDPTIDAALNMLDRMQEIFGDTAGLYGRLVDETAPAITFQLLKLEEFGLSDDLYIKMNARGKPLTNFETFKARFERDLNGLFGEASIPHLSGDTPAPRFFSDRIDRRWLDFLWSYRDPLTADFDGALMNLIRAVIMITRAPDINGAASDLGELRSPTISTYSWFHDKAWLDRDMAVALMTLLERWSAGANNTFHSYLPQTWRLDELSLFKGIATRPQLLPYDQTVQLAGYVLFLVSAEGEINAKVFASWMRVVSNLAINTIYNRPDDLRRSLAGLRSLAPAVVNILVHLAAAKDDLPGFAAGQVAEERVKARLIGLGGGWSERIEMAEGHLYFRGQIGFLLRFCGIDLDHPTAQIDVEVAGDLQSRFDHYFTCASQMIEDLLNEPAGRGRVWERALLTTGDFLLRGNQYNQDDQNYPSRSLLVTKHDENLSWKRLLRNAAANSRSGEVLKDLWDRLGDSGDWDRELAAIIEDRARVDPWRSAILNTPAAYDYAEKGTPRILRFQPEGGIYLLKKSQMNGRHVELFTFCLHESLRDARLSLSLRYEETTSTEDEPGLFLSGRFNNEDVVFFLCFHSNPDVYALYLRKPKEPGHDLRVILEANGFEEKEGSWLKHVSRDLMRTAIEGLDNAVALPG